MRLLTYTAIIVLSSLAVARSSASEAPGRSPFEDAVAAWHMADANGQAAERVRLTVYDNVTRGVNLDGPEREASLRCGGDGRVAEFGGGYLIAGEKAAEALHLSGDKMTFCIRLRDPAGKWDTPLFARHDPNDKLGKIFCVAPLNRHVIGYSQSRRISEAQERFPYVRNSVGLSPQGPGWFFRNHARQGGGESRWWFSEIDRPFEQGTTWPDDDRR